MADQIVFSITFKNGLSKTHHSIDDHPDVQISRENVRSVSCCFVSARYFLVHSAKNIEKICENPRPLEKYGSVPWRVLTKHIAFQNELTWKIDQNIVFLAGDSVLAIFPGQLV